jgi:hypothetical protein
MLTVADLLKNVTDVEGHTHGEDGKFVSQGGGSSSSSSSAPKKPMGVDPETIYDCHVLDDEPVKPNIKDAHEALSRLSGIAKATEPREIRKYEKWWENEPRDQFGKWTSGFSHGAFSPSDQGNDAPVEPPENPKAGHENEPGWMGSTPQMGVSADHPGLDGATGAANSGWLSSDLAFAKPTNPEVAEQGAKMLSQHLENGDFDAAKKLLHANPEILFPFRKQHHGSVKNAKKAAAFLNATTDATWVQHGTFVNKPKNQPPKEEPLAAVAAHNAATPPEPKVPGAPKLIPFDPKAGPAKGSVQESNDANLIHEALSTGNVQAARNIAKENPQSLHALANMKHGSVLEAKSAAAFLHLVTGQTFAQHGTKVNMPKGAVPASSWAHPGFSGTGAPTYSPEGPGGPQIANVPPQTPSESAPSIIPPPGITPPPSALEQAKAPTTAWESVEAKPITGIPKQGGTNPGGFYELADGTKGYAKFYSNPEQMQTEYMANQIYRKIGLNAPDSKLLTIDGKKCIFSPLIKDGTQIKGGVSKESTAKIAGHPQVLQGFAADAILANHDVVGLDHDNMMFTPDGQAHRMDNGGSLKYRAQGAIKPNFASDAVPELDSMRDPKYGAGKIFQGLSDDAVAKQILHVAQSVKAPDIAKIVADAGFKGPAFDEHNETINGRIVSALAWAKDKLPASAQQTADNLAESITAKAPVDVPSAPVGDKLLGGIDPKMQSFDLDSLKEFGNGWTLPGKALKALADGDDHTFAKELTSDPLYLAYAVNKNWFQKQHAEKVAAIMSHLSGKPYTATEQAGSYKVSAPGKNVIAQPPKKISMENIYAVKPHERDVLGGDAALDHWMTSGEGHPNVVNVSPKQLAHLMHKKYNSEAQAKAAAGLIEHSSAYGASPVLDPHNPGKYKVIFAKSSHLKNEQWPGEYKGHADPSSPIGTVQSPGGWTPSPSHSGGLISDQIDSLHKVGMHAAADWLQAHAEANGKIAGPDGTVAKPKTPEQIKQLDAASLSYDDMPVSQKDMSDVQKMVDHIDGSDENANGPSVETLATVMASNPAYLSQLQKETFVNTGDADNFAALLSNKGIDSYVHHDSQGAHIKITGVHQNHVDQIKSAMIEASGQKVKPPQQLDPKLAPKHDLGPMFMTPPANYKSPPDQLIRHFRQLNLAKSPVKLSPWQREALSHPNFLHHLATTPYSKIAAEKWAALLNKNLEDHSARPVKTGKGASAWTIHFAERPVMETNGDYEAAFAAKHGGGDPLASNMPVGVKLHNEHLLPAGVTRHNLVTPAIVGNGEMTQQQHVDALRSQGQHDSANFLESHYANENAEPQHPLRNQGIFLGATKKFANPYLRPNEIMHSVINRGRKLPKGLTPSMLHAKTEEERKAAIAEAVSGSKWNGDLESAEWLREYYDHRDEAHNPKANTFVATPTGVNTATAHPDFTYPGFNPYGRGTPHSDFLQREFAPLKDQKIALKGGSESGNTSAHKSSLTPQRVAPIIGESGSQHDPTHLALPAGEHTFDDIGFAADAKARDVINPLFDEHQKRLADNDPDAMADPHGGLSPQGVHSASQHAYKLTQHYYKPMLEAARAAMPSEEAIRAISKIGKAHTFLGAGGRDLSKHIANAIAQKLGIPKQAMALVQSDTQKWGGRGQASGAYKLRIASNMLRGKAPWENTFVHGKSSETMKNAMGKAQELSPAYLKAMLLNKAITQAAQERFADNDGELTYVRGIGKDAANTMMMKTAEKALADGQKGQQFEGHEMTLAGYAPKHVYSGRGGVLHRVVKPEHVWQSYTSSPIHGYGLVPSEMEHFIANDAGNSYTLMPSSEVKTKGNFITPRVAHLTPEMKRWIKMQKSLVAARDVIKPIGEDRDFPVPKNRDRWYNWVPPNWQPSPDHIKAWHDAVTDPDGVGRLDLARDLGLEHQFSPPEVRRAAANGEIVAQ